MQTEQRTATIYQFPMSRRVNVEAARLETQASVEARRNASRVMVYDSWYHDDAIADAKRTGKH